MQLRCLLLLLPIAGLVAPAAAGSYAPAFGGVTISSVSEALIEAVGTLAPDGGDAGDFTTAEAQAVHLKFMITATDAATATSFCTAADALGLPSKCDYTYTTLLDGAAVTATLPQLEALLDDHVGAVLAAEASLRVHTTDIQNDATWGLDRVDQEGLPLDNSYEYDSEGGNGVKVFVIDTGVRCTHDDFGDRCVRGWGAGWGGNVCPDGVSDCSNDGNGHGSHCAGTIGGTTWGVAKAVTIVAVQVLDAEGSGSWSDVVGGMDWVAAQKAANPSTPMVASMSLGGGASDTIDSAVARLNAAGVTVSVAAGNDNADACNYSPARAVAAVTVGSTDDEDRRSGFSNYGSCVDIFGPGTAITSTWIGSDTATNTISGTSMACPHVSGVLALIQARVPSATPAEATAILLEKAITGVLSNGAVPNIMLQSNIGPMSRAPTAEGETYAPTSTPTPKPSGSPTVQPDVDMGPIACGETKTGDTTNTANIIGNPANDATFSFTVAATSSYEFNTCGSDYDTWVRVLNAAGTEIASGDDDGNCGYQTILQVADLGPGDYTLVIEGYSNSVGPFTVTMAGANGGACVANTNPPTNPPTSPTNPPTTGPPSPPTTAPPAADCSVPGDFHPATSGAGASAIYGPDSRRDESDTSGCWQGVGSSTVVLTRPSNVANNVWANCGDLGDRYSCPDGLRFGDQTTCGFCSGTLIAPNMIATAGHCVQDASDCSGTTVVFDATSDTMTPGAAIPANTIYSCSSIATSVLTGTQDYAVFVLDRAVPASVATPAMVGTGEMPTGAGLMMIGHPSGLPRKYAGNSTAVSVDGSGSADLRYYTDLDAFGGNSGSGVFTTGEAQNVDGDVCHPAGVMVGILVAGQTDYDGNGCPVEYPQGEGGEIVSGGLNLLPYASSTGDSNGDVSCGSNPQTTSPTTTSPPNNSPTTTPPNNPPTTTPPNNPPTTTPPNSAPTTSPPNNPPTTTPPNNPPTTTPPNNPPTTTPPTMTPPTNAPTNPGDCVDVNSNCERWADLGFCLSDSHNEYMHINCRVSCNMCPDDVIGTPPINIDAPTDPTTLPPTSPPPTSNPPTSNPPTNAPTDPPDLCHFTECGRSGRCNSEVSECAANDQLHEVRCCSDVEIDGWRNHGGACAAVWAESDDTSQGWSCTSDATFDEAAAICVDVGARLCTVQEMQDSCTRNTGCGHDNKMIWTSNEGTIAESNMLAASFDDPTTSDEPGIETTTTAQQDAGVDLSASSDADSSNGSSNGGAIAAAIFGTILVVGVIAAILYVRQQKQTAKQLEDGNSRHLTNPVIPAIEPKLSLRMGRPSEEVFQVAPNRRSIQLEPVHTNTTAMPKSGQVAN